PKLKVKPFAISKWVVWEAYQRVKANDGAAGVDGESIEDFERDLKRNLYKLWNRLSSGSYFPASVRAVEIPEVRARRNQDPPSAHCGGPNRSNGRAPVSGAEGGAPVPPRLLRLSTTTIGAGCSGCLPRAVLEKGLGDRS